MGKLAWGALILTGSALVAACSREDATTGGQVGEGGSAEIGPETGGNGTKGGNAGAAGTAPSVDEGGQGSTIEAGAGGAAPSLAAAGGGQGSSVAGESSGGTGGASPGNGVECPELNVPVFISPGSGEHTEEELSLATAFGCPDDSSLRSFSITRFQIMTPSLVVWWSPHSLVDIVDAYRLEPDCAASGLVTPPSRAELLGNYYVQYPYMVTELLQPGIYTRVACAANMETLIEPAPAAATNVSCDTAKLLPLGQKNALAETRILEPSRYYEFTQLDNGEPQLPSVDIHFSTVQTNAIVSATLVGLANGYSSSTEEPRYVLGADSPLTFDAVPPGQYCLEVNMAKGTKYAIWRQ